MLESNLLELGKGSGRPGLAEAAHLAVWRQVHNGNTQRLTGSSMKMLILPFILIAAYANSQDLQRAGAQGNTEWGYYVYQLRQLDNTISFMSEEAWHAKPPKGNFAYTIKLPRGSTKITEIHGSMDGISWCGASAFWAEVRTPNNTLVAVKTQFTPGHSHTQNFDIPVKASFPKGITTDSLTFFFYDDLCTPVTQSWSLVFVTEPAHASVAEGGSFR
jgi:hypothetical protein